MCTEFGKGGEAKLMTARVWLCAGEKKSSIIGADSKIRRTAIILQGKYTSCLDIK